MAGTVRVAFFLPDLLGGGAQRVVCNLVNSLGETEWEVDLVLGRRTGELVGAVSDAVRVVDLDAGRVPGVGVASCIPEFVSYLNDRDPDVLLSALMYANAITVVAAELSRSDASVLPTEHTTFGMQEALKDRVVIEIARRTYPRSEQVVAVSGGVERALFDETPLDEEDVTVVYNPVVGPELYEQADEPVSHPWFESAATDVILGVGRLEPAKNFSGLLRSFALVADERDEVRLLILGEGSERSDLRDLAERLGVADRVELPGYVENPYKYMQRASVFALSSVREGLPTVLVEAMACGCPVVSTDCPNGPSEILADGEYGPLVPTEDDEALARAIEFALDNPMDEGVLRERAEDFSIGAVTDEYRRLVRQYS